MKLSIFLLFCLFFILDLANSTKKNYGKSGQNNFNPSQYRDFETSGTETTGHVGTGTGSIPSNAEGYTQEGIPSGLETFQTVSNLNQDLGNHPFLFSPQHRQMNAEQGLMENQGSDNYSAECEWNGCGSVFSNQNDFVEHVKDHTKEQKGPRRNCFWSGCDGKSISFKNLSRHIRTHTGVKPYVCKYVDQNGVSCNKEFTRPQNLKIHKLEHTGKIITYKCAHCDKDFKNKRDKLEHENLYKDPNYYRCPVVNCLKNYGHPRTLGEHVHAAHGENVWNKIQTFRNENNVENYGLIRMDEHGNLSLNSGGAGISNANQGVSVDTQTPEDEPQHFGDQAYPPQGWQQNFGHPVYQSGGHFEYPAYTHQGGPQHFDYSAYPPQGEEQHFPQFQTHIEQNEHHSGHTTHIPHRAGSGSNTQSKFRLFGKEIYVGDQGVYS
uniref:C2H2-type domain-containing protein n=1 Tax=Meloidogyne enterolobii TaxID=390850 RepID=A0A6V7XKU3_MELEN|nr:unnamed protein product [Meloidogyne enterolobii]